VLYEPPGNVAEQLQPVIEAGMRGEWDTMLELFIGAMGPDMPATLKPTPVWGMLVKHAEATLEELHAIARARWDPQDFRRLDMPVLLMKGTETPAELLQTSDELAAVLPNCQIAVLKDQAHMAMWTAPADFVRSVEEFLLNA
jgi:pimeloyl-ACP methyl ester carboxylesterase